MTPLRVVIGPECFARANAFSSDPNWTFVRLYNLGRLWWILYWLARRRHPPIPRMFEKECNEMRWIAKGFAVRILSETLG